MKQEDHDDLWDLLGRAKEPEVSPFFSRNVLREIRQQEQENPGFLVWLRRRWKYVSVGAFAVCLLGAAAWHQVEQRRELDSLAEALSNSPDYAVISNLDELLASEERSLWVENSGY